MRLRLVALAGLLAVVASGSAGAHGVGVPPPPQVSAITADFRQADFATYYSIDLKPVAGRKLKISWALGPPETDSSCKKFQQSATDPERAVWHHGDADGCDHSKMDARGHTGTVFVDVVDGVWQCIAVYEGTISGKGHDAACLTLARQYALLDVTRAQAQEERVLEARGSDVTVRLEQSSLWLDKAIAALSKVDGVVVSKAAAHLRRAKTLDRLARELPAKRNGEIRKALAEKQAALDLIRQLP